MGDDVITKIINSKESSFEVKNNYSSECIYKNLIPLTFNKSRVFFISWKEGKNSNKFGRKDTWNYTYKVK